ncbi:hypothetical protein ABIE37_000112 [Arthrobacter bambusae]|uniref:Uncharacterized protein n=1 Tax=Arthrobacter bambusae TaxID=1338426 RepID=A0ABV2P0R5_9MICC
MGKPNINDMTSERAGIGDMSGMRINLLFPSAVTVSAHLTFVLWNVGLINQEQTAPSTLQEQAAPSMGSGQVPALVTALYYPLAVRANEADSLSLWVASMPDQKVPVVLTPKSCRAYVCMIGFANLNWPVPVFRMTLPLASV